VSEANVEVVRQLMALGERARKRDASARTPRPTRIAAGYSPVWSAPRPLGIHGWRLGSASLPSRCGAERDGSTYASCDCGCDLGRGEDAPHAPSHIEESRPRRCRQERIVDATLDPPRRHGASLPSQVSCAGRCSRVLVSTVPSGPRRSKPQQTRGLAFGRGSPSRCSRCRAPCPAGGCWPSR
jgi:hypothetical protein